MSSLSKEACVPSVRLEVNNNNNNNNNNKKKLKDSNIYRFDMILAILF